MRLRGTPALFPMKGLTKPNEHMYKGVPRVAWIINIAIAAIPAVTRGNVIHFRRVHSDMSKGMRLLGYVEDS